MHFAPKVHHIEIATLELFKNKQKEKYNYTITTTLDFYYVNPWWFYAFV